MSKNHYEMSAVATAQIEIDYLRDEVARLKNKNLSESEITILVDALECKIYENKQHIDRYKKLEEPGVMLEHYQAEVQEIKSLIIKLENHD